MASKKTKIVGFQSGHDVAYCILENGIPIIHEEQERITRTKMEYGNGLKLFFERNAEHQDIKYFTFANIAQTRGRYQATCRDLESENKMNKIIAKNHGDYFEFGHHLAHGANAFYTSPFDKALIISIDGFGQEEGQVPTTLTIDEGIGNRIKRIKIFDHNQVPIGRVYNLSTKWIFGLSVGPPKGDQAGSVMAMATLGEPKYKELFIDFDAHRDELARLAQISEQERFNVASSLQAYTEWLFRAHIKNFVNHWGHENICLSGGVTLNCVMVGKIKSWFPDKIKNIFCDPVPYDAGLALGSARYLWHHVLGNPRINKFAPNGVTNYIANMSPYLGKVYTEAETKKACKKFATKITVTKTTDREVLTKITVTKTTDREVLTKIADQKIVSVFGGGSESGRRALGNRSILADPRNPEMKTIINEKVKHRQWFRPLAPSVLEEKIDEWFVNPILSPYMSFALEVKEEKREQIPAVVHFDGTARLQTVNKHLSPWYYSFISKWAKMTGIPILINTSFNDSEPIVETPDDAIRCFLNTNIDYLYFFDYKLLVSKK
jgi:carbamoyltransferase